MKKSRVLTVATMLVAMLAGPSVFAEQRYPDGTLGRDTYNDRFRLEGRVAHVERDRGGFRIWLERNDTPIFVREPLRPGVWVEIRGFIRGGVVIATDVDRQVRGVVDHVNYRLGYLVLRQWDGDYVKVDMRPIGVIDVRRGDTIALSGDWTRDGLFRAERVRRVPRAW